MKSFGSVNGVGQVGLSADGKHSALRYRAVLAGPDCVRWPALSKSVLRGRVIRTR